MVNANKIKARIVELGLTQQQVADKLGIDISSFNVKLNNTSTRQFNIAEVQKLTKILEIQNPVDYFFI